MTSIQRFTPDYKMHAVRFEPFAREAEHGEYVRFDAHQQTVSALEAERDALADRVNALAVENAEMRKAIDFATAEDMWIEQHDGMLDYRYQEWYVDVLNAATETPATDAALAAIKKQAGIEAVEEAAYSLYGKGYIFDTIMDYATELREAK